MWTTENSKFGKTHFILERVLVKTFLVLRSLGQNFLYHYIPNKLTSVKVRVLLVSPTI